MTAYYENEHLKIRTHNCKTSIGHSRLGFVPAYCSSCTNLSTRSFPTIYHRWQSRKTSNFRTIFSHSLTHGTLFRNTGRICLHFMVFTLKNLKLIYFKFSFFYSFIIIFCFYFSYFFYFSDIFIQNIKYYLFYWKIKILQARSCVDSLSAASGRARHRAALRSPECLKCLLLRKSWCVTSEIFRK